MASTFKYAATNEAPIYESIVASKGKKTLTKVLLGTYITTLDTEGDFFKVKAFGKTGFMKKSDLSDTMGLKIFYLDVGQGDGVLIEIGKMKILIDAGPENNMYNYLTKFQYKYLLESGAKVHIDYLFVSHFDQDHFKGFTPIINDKRFTFGKIFHAGILKFAETGNPYNTGLGTVIEKAGKKYLTKIFDDFLTMNEPAKFNLVVKPFIDAVKLAATEARIKTTKRLKAGDVLIDQLIDNKPFKVEILAPFAENIDGNEAYVYFKNDDGQTINGHSLVLKLSFGHKTFLFGGDLNSLAEQYIMQKYANVSNPFEVDVAKACHHGSSDFTVEFMAKVNPFATVISSGDNESFSHPRADAIGCAGKYARGARPLVYSTELARSVDIKNRKILFGMINARSNGDKIYISQMKEKRTVDLWDAYEVG
jgi:beta-lactamase superfamily II metal-dependent hydrolase